MTEAYRRTARSDRQLRPVSIETGVAPYAEGSALVAFGATRVWCTASVEDRVPPWLLGRGQGWVTGEYAMLPRATHTRVSRDRGSGSGRSQEISRLIGRALRAGVALTELGERTITVDCDVLQADGGTRTAAITGGFVALALACNRLRAEGLVRRSPVTSQIAAISCGLVAGRLLLDLNYREDSQADLDCNVVMNAEGGLIEVQSTAEGSAVDRATFDGLLDLAAVGMQQLFVIQRRAIADATG